MSIRQIEALGYRLVKIPILDGWSFVGWESPDRQKFFTLRDIAEPPVLTEVVANYPPLGTAADREGPIG